MNGIKGGATLRATCLAIAAAGVLPAAEANKSPDSVSSALFDRLGDGPADAVTHRTGQRDGETVVSGEVVFKRMPANAREQIEAAGAKITNFSERWKRATVELTSRAQADAIGQLRFVRFIRSNPQAFTNAGETGERVNTAHRHAELLDNDNATVGDGAGMRVGIIADSFTHTSGTYDSDTQGTADGGGTPEDTPTDVSGLENQDSGDLPPVVEMRDDSSARADEGAAMAEIVHDVAPSAAISFHQGLDGRTEMAQAYSDLCQSQANGGAGSDVVVDDLSFFLEPVYQPGIIEQAIRQDCITNGVPVVTSAGNSHDAAIRQDYVDVDPNTSDPGMGNGTDARSPDNGAEFHQWQEGDQYLRFTLEPNGSVIVVLQWNQPALSLPSNSNNGPQIDLDLAIYDNANPDPTNTAQVSWNDQKADDRTSGFDPQESAWVTNGTNSDKTYYLAVNHFDGSKGAIPQDASKPLNFSLMFFPTDTGSQHFVDREQVETNPASTGSMYGHQNTEGIISVASLWWNETGAYDYTQGATQYRDVAPYSSVGGTVSLPFAADGTVQDKTVSGPTVTAVDGMNTTFFGSKAQTSQDGENDSDPNFYGTSAAAPNIAGHLAVLQGLTESERSIDELRTLITESTRDVRGAKASAGDDPSTTGAGLYRSDRVRDKLPVATVTTGATGDINPGQTTDLIAEPKGGSMPYSYSWTQLSGPTQALSSPGNSNQVEATFDKAGTYGFAVEVTESSGDQYTVATSKTVTVATADSADDSSGGDSGGGGGGGAFGVLPLALLLGAGVARRVLRRIVPTILVAGFALSMNACTSAGNEVHKAEAHNELQKVEAHKPGEPAAMGNCLRSAVDEKAAMTFAEAVRSHGGVAGSDGPAVTIHIDSAAMDEWDGIVDTVAGIEGVRIVEPARRWERVGVTVASVAALNQVRRISGVQQLTCVREAY